jgi:hypothetical protein
MKKNEKKTCFGIRKNIFSLLLFFGYSFTFGFERSFANIEKIFL